MHTGEIERCCGTCFFWQSEGGSDFTERIKCRFRLPYCKLDNKIRYAESGRGCFGWKYSG